MLEGLSLGAGAQRGALVLYGGNWHLRTLSNNLHNLTSIFHYPSFRGKTDFRMHTHAQQTQQVHESIYLGIETRRKDFKEFVIHHIATLSLLAGSYVYNFTRIGALVAVVHDAADRYVRTCS